MTMQQFSIMPLQNALFQTHLHDKPADSNKGCLYSSIKAHISARKQPCLAI